MANLVGESRGVRLPKQEVVRHGSKKVNMVLSLLQDRFIVFIELMHRFNRFHVILEGCIQNQVISSG